MSESVPSHYSDGRDLADRIAADLRENGVEPGDLEPSDLEALDEFHFRGRAATLELIADMDLTNDAEVLDIGAGLGGVSRTIAEAAGCQVTGVDLTQAFCDAAAAMSEWVGLSGRTEFLQGDATALPFPDGRFDRAVTVHVAMNVADKSRMYEEARRVLKPGGLFGVYDILQGEGGEMFYPAPWAGDPSISHLATPDEMRSYLAAAGFETLKTSDSTEESLDWLEARTAQAGPAGPVPVTIKLLFGDRFGDMVQNQLRGLRERRMLTYGFICRA